MASVETVAEALRRLREARALSLSEAARRADVPRTTLRHWEGGVHAPPGPALEGLLDALRAEPRERAALLAVADPRHARVALADGPLGPPLSRGAILRAMRDRRRMTQSALARSMGVTQGAVAKWESGGNAPDDDALARLATVLGASPGEADVLRNAGDTEGRLTIDEAYARVRALILDGDRGPKEPLILAHEAEVWRRAVRDPRWEPALVLAMGLRALWTRAVAGRPAEALPLARRALGLAARCGAWDEAELAFGCLLDHALAQPDPRPETLAHGLRRSESLAGHMKNPRTQAAILGHLHNLVAAERQAPGGMDEVVRRTEDSLVEANASAYDTALDPLGFVGYRIGAYHALGRIEEMVDLDEATDWSVLPDGGASTRAFHLCDRMFAYLEHGIEPSADELRRFEASGPFYATVPSLRHAARDWHRVYGARRRRRHL